MCQGHILKWVNGYFVRGNTLVARKGGICKRSRILARIGGKQCAGGRIETADILQVHPGRTVRFYKNTVLMSEAVCIIRGNSIIVATNRHDRHGHFNNGRNSRNHIENHVIILEAVLHIAGAGCVSNDVERHGIPYDCNVVWHHNPKITPPREFILGKCGQGGKISPKQAYCYYQTAHRKDWIKVKIMVWNIL